ncbi:MAG: hypothetical protein JRN67_09110 [Nitrososphaerota archaeon]|nr:hypothetical protein [Nitrososphaerota archaeon]
MKVARSRAKNRNRIGIIKEILSLLNESPQARTHIMYKANLAYPQACEYLNDLIAKGLISGGKPESLDLPANMEVRTTYYYIITTKGKHMLDRLTEFSELLDAVDEKSTELIA